MVLAGAQIDRVHKMRKPSKLCGLKCRILRKNWPEKIPITKSTAVDRGEDEVDDDTTPIAELQLQAKAAEVEVAGQQAFS